MYKKPQNVKRLEQQNNGMFSDNLPGAFFAPQKTGLCGAPRSRAPAPSHGRYAAKRRGCSAPLQSLARSRHPCGVSFYNGPQITQITAD
jgi:hypothetical protein